MSFELKKETVGNVLVLSVVGELVLGPVLRHSANHVRDLKGIQAIVVDLSECKKVDSAGLGELLQWYGIAAKAHQKMLIAGASNNVKTMIRVAHVDGILLHAKDRAAAISEIEKG